MLHRVAPYSHRTLPPAFGELGRSIGATPLVRLRFLTEWGPRTVLAKRECANPSGSIKDRMAWEVLAGGYARGELRPGDGVVEATSGNAGIALAALGRELGHRVVIYMPDWMSVERIARMTDYGAEVRLVSREEGGFLGAIARAEALARQPGWWGPRQFSNPDNPRAHARTTGPEIVRAIVLDCAQTGALPGAFVAGVGTGGTVMGVGQAMRAAFPGVRIHPVEPAESPTLSTGHKVGAHRIQGVSDDFIPEIVKLDQLDAVMSVHDGDAILMAQTLARAGLGVGISSGANVVAALRAAPVSVTVLADCDRKYRSTDLVREEPVKAGYLSPEVELLSVEIQPG